MLDQFLTWIFSSWLVFAILAVVLLALEEFGWRVGLARSRGWEAGIAGGHPFLARFLFPLLIAVVIVLITDIDTPRGGLITVDERPLLELNDSLK
jgi:hypothetical protein